MCITLTDQRGMASHVGHPDSSDLRCITRGLDTTPSTSASVNPPVGKGWGSEPAGGGRPDAGGIR